MDADTNGPCIKMASRFYLITSYNGSLLKRDYYANCGTHSWGENNASGAIGIFHLTEEEYLIGIVHES